MQQIHAGIWIALGLGFWQLLLFKEVVLTNFSINLAFGRKN